MADVVARLLAQAALAPQATAVAEGARTTTYATFVARAEAFAAAFGRREPPRVLIALDKGCDAYAAMFGTLMAGGTYAPVNVASPPARLRHIAEMFDPDIVVAAEALARHLTEGLRACSIDPARCLGNGVRADPQPSKTGEGDRCRRWRGHRTPEPSSGSPVAAPVTRSCTGGPLHHPSDGPPPPLRGGGDAIAYVIFTSGSTGAPKGVAISRGALAHYVSWLGPALAIGPGDRMSQHPNIGFDLSVLDIFGALCHGAALHPFAEPSARLLPARKVRADAITIWNSVPSVLSAMETAGELDAAHLASVRLFTFCGEILRRDQVERIFAARPDATVLNTYGPTEATVAMTCRRLTAGTLGALSGPSAPLGAAIGDMRLDLVGGASEEEGEIVISGPQLAAGYWDDPALTGARFRDLATPAGIVRAFHTGDHAKRIDGELYFLGRGDDMIKLRGHRIHLGEVAHALERLGWPRAFVFAAAGSIFAAVESVDGRVLAEASLRDALAGLLDSHFVPKAIRLVERFPRTANDKIDGVALMALFD